MKNPQRRQDAGTHFFIQCPNIPQSDRAHLARMFDKVLQIRSLPRDQWPEKIMGFNFSNKLLNTVKDFYGLKATCINCCTNCVQDEKPQEITTTRGGDEKESTDMTTIEEHNVQPVKKTETETRPPQEPRPGPGTGSASKGPEPGSETKLEPEGEPETGPPSEPGPKPRTGNNAQKDRADTKKSHTKGSPDVKTTIQPGGKSSTDGKLTNKTKSKSPKEPFFLKPKKTSKKRVFFFFFCFFFFFLRTSSNFF